MDIESVRQSSRLGQWAEMVQTCRNSGQPVRSWCKDNGVNVKTYYYRLRRLRMIALGNAEPDPVTLPVKAESYPMFAELTLSDPGRPEIDAENVNTTAATIMVGSMTISINNNAGAAVIRDVIKAASEVS